MGVKVDLRMYVKITWNQMRGDVAATGITVLVQFAAFPKFPSHLRSVYLASNLEPSFSHSSGKGMNLVKFILLANPISNFAKTYQHRRTLSFLHELRIHSMTNSESSVTQKWLKTPSKLFLLFNISNIIIGCEQAL